MHWRKTLHWSIVLSFKFQQGKISSVEYLAYPNIFFWLTFYVLKWFWMRGGDMLSGWIFGLPWHASILANILFIKKGFGGGGGVADGKDPSSVLSYCTMYIFRMYYQLHLFYFCRLWMFFIQWWYNLHENGSTKVALLIWSNFLFSLSFNFFKRLTYFTLKILDLLLFRR